MVLVSVLVLICQVFHRTKDFSTNETWLHILVAPFVRWFFGHSCNFFQENINIENQWKYGATFKCLLKMHLKRSVMASFVRQKTYYFKSFIRRKTLSSDERLGKSFVRRKMYRTDCAIQEEELLVYNICFILSISETQQSGLSVVGRKTCQVFRPMKESFVGRKTQNTMSFVGRKMP